MSFPSFSDQAGPQSYDYDAYYRSCFDRFYAEAAVAEHPAVHRARELAPSLPFEVIPSLEALAPEHRSARSLLAVAARGNAVGRCPGTRGHVCCNYLTVDLYTGCNLGCSYCIMQSYLNFSPITVRIETQDTLERLAHIADCNPGRVLRVGTGETGDSLWLDPLFDLSAELLRGLSRFPNIVLELKTKTSFVDHLLGRVDPAQVVFGFSLNPDFFARIEERAAVAPEQRLAAAERAVKAGYRVAFHFDPIVRGEGMEQAYDKLCARVAALPRAQIAWVSMGTIRYPKELRDALPDRPYLLDEFVPARDGKYRYLQRERVQLYRSMRARLQAEGPVPVYLCMESDVVWRKVFGAAARAVPELASLFAPVSMPATGRPADHEE